MGLHKYQGNNFSPNGHKYIREFEMCIRDREDVVTCIAEKVDSDRELVVEELGIDTKVELLCYFPLKVVGSFHGFCNTPFTISPVRGGIVID